MLWDFWCGWGEADKNLRKLVRSFELFLFVWFPAREARAELIFPILPRVRMRTRNLERPDVTQVSLARLTRCLEGFTLESCFRDYILIHVLELLWKKWDLKKFREHRQWEIRPFIISKPPRKLSGSMRRKLHLCWLARIKFWFKYNELSSSSRTISVLQIT